MQTQFRRLISGNQALRDGIEHLARHPIAFAGHACDHLLAVPASPAAADGMAHQFS